MGVMTERKLMAMFSEAVGPSMDPDYRSGLVAGYYSLESPCHLNVCCAEGVMAGKDLRQLFLSLDGKADDDQVNASIVKLLFPEETEFVPYVVFERADWSCGSRGWVDPFVIGDALPAV